ncbi:MAG: 5-methyltetrahydropteroyltriglutamate--homocysteine S-methyltransferase [Burkholderiales bacterium]
MPLPPVRADQVGSLLRPESLRRAHSDHRRGHIDEAQLQETTDTAIRDAVRMQESCGLGAVSDGEFRRGSWFLGFVEAVHGIALAPVALRFAAEGLDAKSWQGPVVRDKLKRKRPIVADDFSYLKGVTTRIPKATLPTPSAMHFFGGRDGVDPAVYPDRQEFFADLAAIYQEEIADLGARGCRYLQLDEVPLALLCDPTIRASLRESGEDPESLIDLYVGAVNAALAGRPAGMSVVMHLCRGNYRGRWMGQGGYDPIAERLFNTLEVDGFLLEYDSERAGGFEPLRHLPAGKRAFLGLISSKSPVLETGSALKRRLEEAFRHAPAASLGLCPQCGFASSAGGNPLAPDLQWAKLALAARTAQDVWGET